VKKLRKAKRADEKRIKELTEQLETFSKAQRERTVKEVLEKKGINAKAARLILKDLDDVTEESLDGWLQENGDLIGYQAEVKDEAKQQNLAALRQQDVIAQSGISPERADELEMKLDNAQSADELLAFLRSQS
jgi:uncharacterized protein (DUF885 family)